MDDEPNEGVSSGGIQLRDLLAIVQMQWKLVTSVTIGAGALALLHGMLVPRQYQSTAVLQLSSMAGQEMRFDVVVERDQYNRWNRQLFVQTQIEIMRSASLTRKVVEAYRSAGGTDLTTDLAGRNALLDMLEINPRQGTELVDVSITTEDPNKSATLANLVATTYRDNNLELGTEPAQAAREWVEAQIREHDLRIAALTTELVKYQQKEGLADVSEDVSSLVDVSAQMRSLNEAYAQVNTERVLLETTVSDHEGLIDRARFVDLAKQLDTPLVQSLTHEYALAVTEHAEIASRYLNKHPERVSAEAKLARIEQELRKEVRATVSAEKKQLDLLKSKEASLKSALDGYQDQLTKVSGSREGYGKLKAELARAKEFYGRLTQRRDELELQGATQLNNVQLIDRAEALPRPVFPNVPLNVAIAILGGLVIGIVLGFTREYVDDTVSTPLEIKTFLKTQFLGMIPKIANVTDEVDLALYSHQNPRSPVAEAMRGIRTMIELDPNGPPRRLLVTSAVMAEGKTSTVVRLGVAYANLGRRVIAIDADLRRPRLHKIFGATLDAGLSSVLRGGSLDDAIVSTPVENFDFMTSGRGGDRPNELLASARMRELLDELSDQYDLVLVDSPPTVLLSDARILSRHVDGVIMLVREQTTSRAIVRDAIANLEQVNARVLGVIVNAVSIGRGSAHRYQYGGYGYTYGRYEQDVADVVAEDGPKRAA